MMSPPPPTPGLDDLSLPPPPAENAIDPERDRLRRQLFGGPAVPPRIGRFAILRALGAGGMGQVYVAYDEQLDRKVAVKVLRQDIAEQDHHQQRLLREAQALARLSHPNVVGVFEAGQTGERVFLAMELVSGQSLRQWQGQRRWPWREVLGHYLAAGRGLAAAHAAGLVHRDFKPDNVLLGDDGRVRVADFGLAFGEGESFAEVLDEQERSEVGSDQGTAALDERITRTGARLGTLPYMAPEQMRGGPVGPKSDQFAFCVSLYEGLIGERPPSEITTRAARGLLVAHRGQAPRWLLKAVLRGLTPKSDDRHPDMDALLDSLTRRLQRRRRFGAVIVAGGLLGAGVLARPTTAAPCEAAGEELEDLWSDAHRQRIGAAFEATGVSFARRAWQDTHAELDAYTAAWSEQRADACEATHVRHVQSGEALDLRAACLDGRRRELTALLEALERVDATGVISASEAVLALPPPQTCGDLEALRRGVAPPPVEQADEVESLRVSLAHARSARSLGDNVLAERLLSPALAQARGLNYEPVLAESLHLHGQVLLQRGELESARTVLLEAVDLAEARHHDALAADVWAALSLLATRRLRDASLGRAWLRRAWAAARRLGSSDAAEADLLIQQGHLAMLRNRYDEAEPAYREALARREQLHGPEHPAVAATVAALANCSYEAGSVAEARVEYERALSILVERLGPEHPRVGEQRFNLALVHETQGRLDAAAAELDAALASYRRAYGRDSPRTIKILSQRAKIAEHQGKLDEAIDLAQQAGQLLSARARSDAADYDALVTTLNVIGTLHYRQRNWEASLESFSRALELTTAQDSPAPLQLAFAHSNVGDALLALKRPADAQARYAMALELMRPLLAADHENLTFPLLGAGRAALALGDVETALEHLRRALEIRLEHPGNRPELATTQWALARALALGSPPSLDEARQLALDAREHYRALGDDASVTEIDQWLTP